MHGTAPGRLDVIMPAYNAAATITQSLHSALASPLCRRVHVIDDASTDRTVPVVEALAARAAGRIVLTRLAENGGPAYARNIGLALSDADLVAFLDADDTYENQALYVAATVLDNSPDLAIVRLALRPVGLSDEFLNHPGFDAAWTRVTFTVPSNVVARRSVIAAAGGFPEHEIFRHFGGEDVALFHSVTRTCRVGTLFTEPGVRYGIRGDCAALRLLRSCLFGITPPDIAAALPKAEAVTMRIMQRIRLLSAHASPEPAVVAMQVSWDS